MSATAIHGYQLEITVVRCWELRDSSTTFHDQDPYVKLEYANISYKTQVCKRKCKHPIFNQKFKLIHSEGCHEIKVAVWNKNTIERDYLIGTASVPLTTVLLNGFDDNWWPLQYENRHAGQIKLVMNKLTVPMNNVMRYNLPAPSDLPSSRGTAIPYMAYPPPSYPITSQPSPSSVPRTVLLPSTESRSVSFAIAQPMPPPPPPQQTLPVPSSRVSIPFNPSAPSAPEETFSYHLPSPPPPIMMSSSYTTASTDLQNHPAPVSPSSHVSPRYQEERVDREVPAVGEERSQKMELVPADPSPDQTLVQERTPLHPTRTQMPANTVRHKKPKNSATATESYNAAATDKSSPKASPSLSGKAKLCVFVFCLLITLYVKVGCARPDLSMVVSQH